MRDKLWVCGKMLRESESGAVWELQGVFSKESLAVDCCTGHNYFVGEVVIDSPLPEKSVVWSSCYYSKSNPAAERG